MSKRTGYQLRSFLPSTRDGTYLATLAALGLWVTLQRINRPMKYWDESFYAHAGQIAADEGYWIIPYVRFNVFAVGETMGLQPVIYKPGLVIWLQGLSMEIFGVSPAAARVPSILLMVGTAIVVFLFARRLFSSRAGLLSGAVFLVIPHVLVTSHGGTSATLDPAMLFFGTGFLYVLFVAVEADSPDYLPIAGILLTLAILSKGINAAIFGVLALPLLIIGRHLFVSRRGAIAIATPIVVTIGWVAIAETVVPGATMTIIRDNLLRRLAGTNNVATVPGTFSWMKFPYFRRAPGWYDPWGYIALPGAAALAYEAWRGTVQREHVAYLGYWFAATYAVFATAGNHGWYVLPAAVPVALAAGWTLARVSTRRSALIALAAGWVLTVVSSPRIASLAGRIFEAAGAGLGTTTIQVITAAAGVSAIAFYPVVMEQARALTAERTGSAQAMVSVALAIVLVVGAGTAAGVVRPTGDESGQAQAGQKIKATTPPDAIIHIEADLEKDPLHVLAFYSNREIVPANVSQINDNARYAVVREQNVNNLSREYRMIASFETPRGVPVVVIGLDG